MVKSVKVFRRRKELSPKTNPCCRIFLAGLSRNVFNRSNSPLSNSKRSKLLLILDSLLDFWQRSHVVLQLTITVKDLPRHESIICAGSFWSFSAILTISCKYIGWDESRYFKRLLSAIDAMTAWMLASKGRLQARYYGNCRIDEARAEWAIWSQI